MSHPPPTRGTFDKGIAMSTTLVGVFDTAGEAQEASSKLANAGIEQSAIRLSGGVPASGRPQAQERSLPGEKPGAISRFFSDLFGTHDDAATYTEAVQRGNVVLSFEVANEERVEEFSDILKDCGAVDVDERVEQWRADGYLAPTATKVQAGAQAMPRSGSVRIHRSGVHQAIADEQAMQGTGDGRDYVRRTEADVEESDDAPPLRNAYFGAERRYNTNPYSGAERRAAA